MNASGDSLFLHLSASWRPLLEKLDAYRLASREGLMAYFHLLHLFYQKNQSESKSTATPEDALETKFREAMNINDANLTDALAKLVSMLWHSNYGIEFAEVGSSSLCDSDSAIDSNDAAGGGLGALKLKKATGKGNGRKKLNCTSVEVRIVSQNKFDFGETLEKFIEKIGNGQGSCLLLIL